jgi:hypothetical protein
MVFASAVFYFGRVWKEAKIQYFPKTNFGKAKRFFEISEFK